MHASIRSGLFEVDMSLLRKPKVDLDQKRSKSWLFVVGHPSLERLRHTEHLLSLRVIQLNHICSSFSLLFMLTIP